MRKTEKEYRQMVAANGEAWADRIWGNEVEGMPLEPPGDSFMKGCPVCAGYGKPGWVVADRKLWMKCTGCNGEGADHSGRDVFVGYSGGLCVTRRIP